ncbi:MAG: hypothetical protein RSA20_01645 [Oscillospiraceae bacterium]
MLQSCCGVKLLLINIVDMLRKNGYAVIAKVNGQRFAHCSFNGLEQMYCLDRA